MVKKRLALGCRCLAKNERGQSNVYVPCMVLQFFTDALLFQVVSRQIDWVSTCAFVCLLLYFLIICSGYLKKRSFRPVGGWILLTVKMSLCEMYCSCWVRLQDE